MPPRPAAAAAVSVLALVVAASPATAQQRVQETVVVTGAAAPVPFETLTRSVRVITWEDLARLPVSSVVDAIRLAAGVDVRARGSHGVQADFATRGANFNQTLVLVDGVRLNNSQTAHHNGDLPVTLDQVERIEVLYGPGSSLYGADAFGGTVNIVTRSGVAPTTASLAIGAHDTLAGTFSTGFEAGPVAQGIHASAQRSNGFMFDRDFRTSAIASRTALGSRTVATFGFADKEFGANGFYGNSPSREWTRQFSTGFAHEVIATPRGALSLDVSYRTHRDRFLWDVRRPGLFENRHRTHAALVDIAGRRQLGRGWQVSGGFEQAGDWIRSSNLGDHDVFRTGVAAEAQGPLGTRTTLAAGLRLDRYSTFGSAWNPSLGASTWVSSAVRLRASMATAFRVPSFTELYYRDPAHQASPDLLPERAIGTEVSADWVPHPEWVASATLFDRRERDVIDWVKAAPADTWQTRNIRRVHGRGIELGVRRAFGEGRRLSVDYAFNAVDPESVPLLSKYTLDYARHGVSVAASTPLAWGLWAGGRLDVRQRTGRPAYTLIDVRLSRAAKTATFFVDAANLLDTSYEEIRGVAMPGRWVSAGLQWRLP
jgi:iron complex outermembrane receptor protein